MPKNRESLALLGGVLGFLVSGLVTAYIKLLRRSPELLFASIVGGVSTFAALYGVDALSEWVERRNRRALP